MSGNPNKQKMGKRKGATAKQQPDWLFPGAGNSSNDVLAKRSSNNNAPTKQSPPSELVGLVEAFLAENQYTNTSQTFAKENKARGQIESNINDVPSLSAIYNEWRQLKREGSSAVEDASKQHLPLKSIKKDVSSSSSDSDSSSETSSDENDSDVEMANTRPISKEVRRKSSPSASSSSSSDSDADDENETPVIKASSPKKPKANTLKRKEHPDTSSSSSDSDSDSTSKSSSEDEAPKAKKAKTGASSSSEDSSSDSSSASESDSDSSSENKTAKTKKAAPEPISSGSESSSESDSDSDSSTHSIAQKVPLPESDSESTSDSDSDSDSDNEDNKQTSDTSATLSDHAKKSASSAESSSGVSSSGSEIKPKVAPLRKLSPPLPPNPVKGLPRKTNERFSRIPKNIQVDQRLASNAYVPYDYAQKAHEDLIVTKGKGFTKEKNKKKRGSYRGGYIDVEGKKGIKFDD